MEIKNLSFSYGIDTIFDNVNILIPDNEIIGITGLNGAGKSTLFNILINNIEPDSGKIIFKPNTRVELLPQTIRDDKNIMDLTVYDYIESARPIKELEDKLIKLYEESSTNMNIFNKIDKVEKELDYWGRYSYETEMIKIIEGMKLDDFIDKKIKELSGGMKSKVAFARILYSNPELMLLDEPTNHLDEETKNYVINFLRNYNKSVYIISHDIDFLDNTVNKILHIEKYNHSVKLYNGNYSYFLKQYEEEKKVLTSIVDKQEKEEESLRKIIRKYEHGNGNRKKMAQDREHKLEKLLEEKLERPPEYKNVKLDLDFTKESGMTPVKTKDLCFKYDLSKSKGIINKLNIDIHKGERFLIVGENGAGKSTLIKLIVGKLIPTYGEVIIGNNVVIGYYAQEHESLDLEKNLIDNFDDTMISPKEVRNILGRFLFREDDVFKLVKHLSPGERARLALAKLSITKANLLILDEPTNHLDPETQDVIGKCFKDYKGTMIVVSHNPNFVDNLNIDKMLILPDAIIKDYDKIVVEKYHELNKDKIVVKNRRN